MGPPVRKAPGQARSATLLDEDAKIEESTANLGLIGMVRIEE